MTTPKEHGETPSNLSVPVYRHASETARSANDAGGQIPPSQYENKVVGDTTRKA